MTDGLSAVLTFVLILALLVVLAGATIWSLNTLFGVGIAYRLDTMLAAMVLLALFGASKGK
jgi:hypothetical protein